MDKRYSAVLFVSIMAITALGQTLTEGNSAVRVGDVFTTHRAPYVPPGNGGENVTWDFSTPGTGTIVAYTHVAPASTPYAASFPASNVAQQLSTGEILFVQSDASGMQLWGQYGDSELQVYSDAERFMTYPCSYGSAWVDEFAGTFSVSGVPWTRFGTVSATADGYGSVIMPYGTLDNVLRVHAVQTTQDEYAGGEQLTLFNVHYYYRVGVHYPLVSVADGLITTDLGTFPLQFVTWIEEGSVGMAEALMQPIGIEVYPNPATAQVNVVFGAGGSTALHLEVIDAAGRVVYQRNLGQRSTGIQLEQVDVSSFAPGLYNVRITDGQGGQGVQRLVVE